MFAPPKFKQHPTEAGCCIMYFVNPANRKQSQIVIKDKAFFDAIVKAGKLDK